MERALAFAPVAVLAAGFALGALAERLAPLAPADARPWRHALRNGVVLVVHLVIATVLGAVLGLVARGAETRGVGLLAWAHAPAAVRVALGVVLLDLVAYVRHRVSHRVPVLWRLHRMHHTDPAVDVTSALRNHPAEVIYLWLAHVLAVLALGIPALALAVYTPLILAVDLFQHARIRLPPRVDAALSWLVVTPRMHRVHHFRAREDHDANYGVVLGLWDRLLRSFRPPPEDVATPRTGLDGFDDDAHQSVLGQLTTPFD